MTVEPKLTDTPDIKPVELPEAQPATMMHFCVGYESNFKFSADLSDTTRFVALKSDKP